MTFLNKSLLGLVLVGNLLVFPINTKAEGWEGICPLKSLRSDVFRKLGACKSGNDSWDCLYELKDKNIIIYYVNGDCKNGSLWKVQSGTVKSIVIHFKKKPLLKNLNINVTKFSVEDDPELPGIRHLNDEDKGLYLVVEGESVMSIYYTATKEEKDHLRCNSHSFI